MAAGVTRYREAPTLNLQGRFCMTQRWSRRIRKRKDPAAAAADEVILKIFRVQTSTPRHLPAKEFYWLTRRQDRYVYKPANINRRQQLQGSEDSLGRQQGAEDTEWPSLARVEGTLQPWLATSVEEEKLRTESRVRQRPSQDLPAGRKTQRKTGFKGVP